jgi:hypothetical protein
VPAASRTTAGHGRWTTGKSHSDVYRAQFDNITAKATELVEKSKKQQGVK